MILNRRKFITATGISIAGGLAGYSTLVEPDMVEFTYHTINDTSDDKISFAQITDLHIKRTSRIHESIGLQLSKEKLDFIVITGDSIDSNDHFQALDDFMSMLPTSLPKYAILGNWEHWGNVSVPALGELYSKWNCDLLVNRSITIVHKDQSILLTGLDDLISGIPSPLFALKDARPHKDHFLLAHCPQHLDRIFYLRNNRPMQLEIHKEVELSNFSFANIFSGHTHGGQINILGITPFVPEGSGGYIKGWYKKEQHSLYVSRGVGTSILPMRIGSIPEVAIFDYFFTAEHAKTTEK